MEEKKSGWLSKAFWGAVKIATVVLVANIGWQLFLDPLFIPPFHDPTNTMGQAWVHMVNENFGWIPQATGLTKKSGLLTNFMKWILGDHIEAVTPPTGTTIMDKVPQGLDADNLFDTGVSEAFKKTSSLGGQLMDNIKSFNPFDSFSPALSFA